MRVPYYIVFSRYTSELQAFRLVAGEYEPAELTNGRLLIPQLKLSLGLWQGSFENIERLWLRWFTLSGEMILTPTEESAVAQERAILAEQEAVEARQKAEKLAAKLRELGIDPNELS